MNLNNPKFLQEVKENGYIKLDDIFTNEEITNLEINCMKALNEASNEHVHANTDFAKVVSVSEKTLNDDNNFNFLKPFFYNENILNFIKTYFDSEDSYISKIFVQESSNTGEKVDVLPYKMHFDKTRYLKFMFYIRDVGPGDGAITFAKREWNNKLQEELLKRQALKEENVVEIHDKSQIEELQGSAGTLVIFDTNVTHKAGQVLTDNKRLIIRIDTTTK